MASVKEIFESDLWIITKVMQGNRQNVRIDAKTRFHRAGENNFFSKWVSYAYAEKLSLENYGKKLTELRTFKY
jgi:hypothetical protein